MEGEVIHGYRVERALAADKGGFGDVYIAVHVDSGAEAVVKVLKPEMSVQRDIVTRFFNEARAAASVHHPGVVQIHNVGYHGDRAYLLMERLRGDDLEARLAAGPLPVERAVVFMRQAAGAVGAAHERGIVHRDLKPANLFVVADPDVVGGERIKVLDFGIAKLTADAGAGKTQGVFGTPAYMSPEQCASTGAVDARADLYSLGCIFYELVCGRPPFGQGGLELIAAHLRDTPPPPRAIAPWVPPPIEQVILALLEKQPVRRLPSCAALIAALDAASASAGLAGFSAAQLPAMGTFPGPPGPATGAVPAYSTTLGAAAGAHATAPPVKRGGAWFGAGAVVVVAAVVAVILVLPGHRAGHGGDGSAGSAGELGSAGSAGTAPGDGGSAGSAHAAGSAGPRTAQGSASGSNRVAAGSDAAGSDGGDVADAVRELAADGSGSSPQLEMHAVKPSISLEAARRAAQLNQDGKQAMFANDYQTARRRYQEAVGWDPDPKYWFNLAVANVQLGLLDEGNIAARRALQSASSEALKRKAQKLLDIIAREDARARGAAASARSAASAESEAATLANAAEAEAAAGRYDNALAQFRRAYEVVPQAEILFNIGKMEHRLGRCAEAVRTLQRIEPTWPHDPAVPRAGQLLRQIGPCPL